MIRRPPRSTRTDTLFPYTTLFRSPPVTLVTARRVGVRVFQFPLYTSIFDCMLHCSIFEHAFPPALPNRKCSGRPMRDDHERKSFPCLALGALMAAFALSPCDGEAPQAQAQPAPPPPEVAADAVSQGGRRGGQEVVSTGRLR